MQCKLRSFVVGTRSSRGRAEREGFALLSVLMVLLALLVLCAPFLMTARNASKASTQLADRAQARLALDSAARNARASLGSSYPAVDNTPYYDDEQELEVRSDFLPGFVDPHDAHGVMWDATVSDIAGAIDLNSAPPQVFANLLGATTRLVAAVKATDKELNVSSTWGFPPVGFLWVDRELIGYTQLDGQKFKGLQRGLGGKKGEDGNPLPCGPQPAGDHIVGTVVIDQRAWAPVLWRATTPDGSLRAFDAPEQLRDCAQLALGIDFKKPAEVEAFVATISSAVSTYGGVRAGRVWQRPVRLKNSVRAGIDCLLDVDERRWFNRGATVMISDGQSTELGIVASVEDRGFRLMDPVHYDYDAFRAEVSVLARRPVNVNMASRAVLEVVFTNLAVRGKNERITRDEAEALAQLVIDSRPFTGFEDFVRRIVLPAAALEKLPSDAPVVPAVLAQGGGIIGAFDAVALYANALNANDAVLEYSTMPFSFTTRDVFDLDLRASVNAPSGVERIAAARDAVEMIVPQRDLMQLWARQEDFDEMLRLDCEAPWWSTGPSATSLWDNGASPPSRLWPHLGTYAGKVFLPGVTPQPQGAAPATPPVATHVFASREDTAWAQLWASRVDESGLLGGRVMHFDYETRDNEGRYLPDETVVQAPADKMVQWTSATEPLLRALNFSMWIKPHALADGTFLDVGRTSLETDRVTLGIEGPDLVLRVYDAGGDISTTSLREAGEARYALAPGKGAGLAQDTWSHVAIDVRGTRPSQMSMLVDGRAIGVRSLGLTKLMGALGDSSTTINVESTEGFPDRGVLRIGNELIEFTRTGNTSFDATPQLTPAYAGFGGRLARVIWQADPTGATAGIPDPTSTASINVTHANGTPVELYGYSAVLASNVPAGSGTLTGGIGMFRVAVVDQVLIGSQQPGSGEPLVVTITPPGGQPSFPFTLGDGIEGIGSTMTGLVLKSADDATQPAAMDAFNPGGGYAALVSKTFTLTTVVAGGKGGSPIGGVEIVRYSGYTGNTLNIIERGVKGTGSIPTGNQGGAPTVPTWDRRAFVVQWANGINAQYNSELDWKTFIVPISIPAPGASGVGGFPDPTNNAGGTNGSEFAQITEPTSVDLTEWVRYDDLLGDQLVRNDASALWNDLHSVLVLQNRDPNLPQPPPQPPTPPPVPNFGPVDDGALAPDPASSAVATAEPAPPIAALAAPAIEPATAPASAAEPAAQSTSGAYLWQAFIGKAGDDQYYVTRAARTAFQFRGVLGTYSHAHNGGALVLPVWRVEQGTLASSDPDRGIPGRLDTIVLMEDVAGSLGWPVTVERAYRPFDHVHYTWNVQTGANALVPIKGATTAVPEDSVILLRGAVCVALDRASPAPVPKSLPNPSGVANFETRTLARALKHPSGERPRDPDRVIVGGTIRNAGIPSATVDEIVFGSTQFGNTGATQGGQLVLTEAFNDGAQALKVARGTLRIAYGRYSTAASYLPSLTQNGGLLRIGNEIVCYSAVDDSTGTLTIPPGGRGLLGTTEAPHEIGESAQFLDQWTVGVLAASLSADGNTLSLTDNRNFPYQGTVIVGDELMHYTRTTGMALEMPRHSSEPGRQDNKGSGLFRGRFGTTAAGHANGDPVILFPFRYWDRWADRGDGPELAYFSLCVDQPQGFFRDVFWTSEEPSAGQARIEVLQRLTTRGTPPVPWDGDPDTTKGLAKLTQGTHEGKPNVIGDAADLVEWRVHVIYDVNAFDAVTGLSHGWKQTPHLKVFGTEYLGPNLVLRRVDQ